MKEIGLSNFAPRGGCSCKVDPGTLASICSSLAAIQSLPGNIFADDAAIVDLDDDRVVISSIDFQNALVDDPSVAGEIAAKNALSDIYACGGKPQFATAILMIPAIPDKAEIGQPLWLP